MTQVLQPGAEKALLTVSALDSKLGLPAELPGPPAWSATDGTVLELVAVAGREDQVFVKPVGPGLAAVNVTSGGLSASLDFEVPKPVVVPVADSLKIDVQILPLEG